MAHEAPYGRRSASRYLPQALIQRRSPLVTLTGPPGIGKTRLARKVAEERPGGTAVVELAAIADPALVPRALASALSVQEVAGRRLIDAVIAHLRLRSLLLVIDNCEHLIGASAEMIDSLLTGCPELSVVATSREPLGIEQESVWQVPPLSVPDPTQDRDPEALMGHAGVRLFVERAATVQPGFALNAYLASDVAEICRRLDGTARSRSSYSSLPGRSRTTCRTSSRSWA